ncbi:MAG: AfsR/SARP family transcriptional regulator [Bacillota bacterium]
MVDADFKFYGLGSFYFEYRDKMINGSNWVSKKALCILMYLVQEKKNRITVEELVDVFWPESELEDGKNKLYNTIYLLRKSLKKNEVPKDIIESVNGAYNISSSYTIWTDWDYFKENVNNLLSGKEFSIEELKSILELYRGDYFSSLKYEEWTDLNREKMREYYLILIEKITEKLYNQENYRETLNYLHKGIEYDPYRESFYLLYIKASVKLGRIAEAINSYKKCERILKEELNVPPGHELKNEYQRIKISREISEKVKQKFDSKPEINSGAMFCDVEVFQKIYELEMRHVKRLNKEFVLISLDLSVLDSEEVNSELLINKIAEALRKVDVICYCNQKVYIILKEIGLENSGLIMQRFNNLYKDLDLDKRPSLDIKVVH